MRTGDLALKLSEDIERIIPHYLKKYTKREFGAEVRAEDYGLTSIGHLGHDQAVWKDSDEGLALLDKVTFGSPICAMIGYGFKTDEDPIAIVSQIQAVRRFHTPHCLRVIRWERMLLRILTDFCFENGIRTVAVQPAEKNHYYNHAPVDRDRHLRSTLEFQADLKRRYDGTAKREGFRYDQESGFYLSRKEVVVGRN